MEPSCLTGRQKTVRLLDFCSQRGGLVSWFLQSGFVSGQLRRSWWRSDEAGIPGKVVRGKPSNIAHLRCQRAGAWERAEWCETEQFLSKTAPTACLMVYKSVYE